MSQPVSSAQVRVTPVPEELLHPALQAWSRVWRYLLVVLGGLVAWGLTAAEQLHSVSTQAERDLIGALEVRLAGLQSDDVGQRQPQPNSRLLGDVPNLP